MRTSKASKTNLTIKECVGPRLNLPSRPNFFFAGHVTGSLRHIVRYHRKLNWDDWGWHPTCTTDICIHPRVVMILPPRVGGMLSAGTLELSAETISFDPNGRSLDGGPSI